MLRPLSSYVVRRVILLALLASIALSVASDPGGAGPADGGLNIFPLLGFVFRTIGWLIVIGAGAAIALSPLTSAIAHRKGNRAEAWMGAATIPVGALVVLGLVVAAPVESADGLAEQVALGLLLAGFTLIVVLGLAVTSFLASIKPAKSGSIWARQWYPESPDVESAN